MRNFDLDWSKFYDDLQVYRQLSMKAREALLKNGSQYRTLLSSVAEDSPTRELLAYDIYAVTPKSGHVTLAPQFQALSRMLRTMLPTREGYTHNGETFSQYIQENYTRNEWIKFNAYYWPQSQNTLYAKIGSPAWLEDFLKSSAAEWEARYRLDFESVRFTSPPIEVALKDALKRMMAQPGPITLEELYSLADRATIAKAINAGIRYMLLFPMLPSETLDPLIGIWPRISQRLHRSAATPPNLVKPVQTFSAPLIIDAMSAVLTACVAEPLRILAGSQGTLYAKSEKQVEGRLAHVADWVPDDIVPGPPFRIEQAIASLKTFGYIKPADIRGDNYRFEVTEGGRNWLAQPVKTRVKAFLDHLRAYRESKRNPLQHHWADLGPALYTPMHDLDTHRHVWDAFARLPQEGAVYPDEFIAYEATSRNPLIVGSKDKRAPGWHDGAYDEDALEQQWGAILFKTIQSKLVLYGVVDLGHTTNGIVTIGLSELGKYLFGFAKDFSLQSSEQAGAIVVQPNFEIVFMAPSAFAEAELSSFTERHGKHVGAVFKITKQSVWAAAAAGISADDVLEKLRAHSSVPVPANVEREIQGWMNQCRIATMRPAVLIHCPDVETASRALAADRTRLTQITDTVLELNDPSYRSKLVKKLREIGIFI